MSDKILSLNQANETFPVGVKVRYYPVSGNPSYKDTVIISKSWALGHGDIVIKVESNRGGVSVDNLR